MPERVQTAKIAKSASTVVVACKLPAGLILQLWEMAEQHESSPTGTRLIKKAQKRGDPVKLNGCALPFGHIPDFPLPGGYALTSVPADFWEEWLAQNLDSDAIKNRIIFAHDSADKAGGQAREQAKEKVKSGLEQIDPKNPPRVGMKIQPYTQATESQ